MRPLGALVVGIGDYRLDREKFPRLQFPALDATEFAKYLAACWPEAGADAVAVIKDEHASRQSIEDAVCSLARAGPFELLFVFLSGHGVVGEKGRDTSPTGFVLQPAPGSDAPDLLTPADLDRLLGALPATRCVLILDCCYAEGIVRHVEHFTQLGNSDARLFVASSREDQRTWEDESVRHGIFSAHLLDLLNSGNSIQFGEQRDRLDVDGELFPFLCQQVPLYVLEHKQQRQEPVKGGVSVRSVTLPVARFARRVKDRSAFGTAVRRLRQLTLAILCGGVAVLLSTYALAYYTEIDRDAHIRLRHGLKWLQPVFQYLPDDRVDTGIGASDLSEDPATRYALVAGTKSGVWTQRGTQGYRGWYDAVRPSLAPRAASRYDVLAATGQPTPDSQLNDESRPVDIALAAWALLDHSEPAKLERVLSHVLGADRTAPLVAPINRQEMDFNVLDRSPGDLAHFAQALRSVAVIDPERTFVAYIGFLKACSLWIIHSTPEQRGLETQRQLINEVVSVLHTIGRARVDRGAATPLSPQMVDVLTGLAAAGYSPLAQRALNGVLAATARPEAALVDAALAQFRGDPSDSSESAALQRLRQGLDGSMAALRVVEAVQQRFVQAGQPEHTDLTAFLITAGDRRSIPPAVIETLLQKAREALARDQDVFMDSEYARILAHGITQVPEPSRALVYQLIERVGTTRPPMSTTMAEIYSTLARQRMATDAMVQRIIERASAAKPRQTNVAQGPVPGLVIIVGPGPWLYALGVLGTTRELPESALMVLEAHAGDPGLEAIIVRAFLNQPGWSKHQCWKTGCRRVLAEAAHAADRRALWVSLMSASLAQAPREEYLRAMQILDAERRDELEPELRIALGQVRVNATQARVAPRRSDDVSIFE